MWPFLALSPHLRQTLTRVFCWAALIGSATAVIGAVAIVIATINSLPRDVIVLTSFLLLMPIAVLGQVAALILWIWRTCDRCSFRLFPLIAGNISGIGRIPPLPDYRAEQFLGSYHWGPVVAMATKGRVRCARCGHKDGTATDRVVIAPQ